MVLTTREISLEKIEKESSDNEILRENRITINVFHDEKMDAFFYDPILEFIQNESPTCPNT